MLKQRSLLRQSLLNKVEVEIDLDGKETKTRAIFKTMNCV